MLLLSFIHVEPCSCVCSYLLLCGITLCTHAASYLSSFIINNFGGYFKAFAIRNSVLEHRCKINYRWMEDLNMEGNAIQCLGRNIGDHLHDLWGGKNFPSETQRAHTIKENNDELLYSRKWTCWGCGHGLLLQNQRLIPPHRAGGKLHTRPPAEGERSSCFAFSPMPDFVRIFHFYKSSCMMWHFLGALNLHLPEYSCLSPVHLFTCYLVTFS